MQKLIGILKMIVDCGVEELGVKGSLRQGSIPTKPRFRSVPDVAVLNSQIPLLAGLLIKYRRLPRGFLWNTSLPSLGCWLFSFLKSEFHGNNQIKIELQWKMIFYKKREDKAYL